MSFQLGHAIRKGGFPTALLILLFSGIVTGDNVGLTQDRVRELFDYREDGCLVRKTDASNSHKAGSVVGSQGGKSKYKHVRFNGKLMQLHRVIFAWHHGYVPDIIDHINRDSRDNRIENLRESSMSKNNFNRVIMKTNCEKVGVQKTKNGKFKAGIVVDKNYIHLGTFGSFEESKKARENAELKYYGEYSPS